MNCIYVEPLKIKIDNVLHFKNYIDMSDSKSLKPCLKVIKEILNCGER